jgi:hypothetical protein
VTPEAHDDDLSRFEADGARPLPAADAEGHVEHDGARIWFAAYGAGAPVILLHGGMGHGGNWGRRGTWRGFSRGAFRRQSSWSSRA